MSTPTMPLRLADSPASGFKASSGYAGMSGGEINAPAPDFENVMEFYEERAGVYQFMANMPLINAESSALRATAERFGQKAAKRVQELRKALEKHADEMRGVFR